MLAGDPAAEGRIRVAQLAAQPAPIPVELAPLGAPLDAQSIRTVGTVVGRGLIRMPVVLELVRIGLIFASGVEDPLLGETSDDQGGNKVPVGYGTPEGSPPRLGISR